MREIKFRAWNGKIMWDVYTLPLVDPDELVTVISPNGNLSVMQKPVIMQYTGLKDKNNKEIYEGDILYFTVFDCFGNDTQYKGVIVYSDSRFMIWNKPDDEYYGADGGFDLDWVIAQDCELEIIGNIYENPELLGGNNEQ